MNNGWWYTDESTTNRFAVLMRYEPDVADVPDLYWNGATGKQTLSDGNTNDWFTAEGDEHRYGDGVNIYITNVAERLELQLDRSTGLRVEEIVMDENDQPKIENGVVVTNFYSAGHTGHKSASPKTLNVYESPDVYLDSHDSVIATSGVCVSNSVVEVDGYLLVDGNIAVIDNESGLENGTWLTATQLVHRSSWYVSSNATFHAGYMDPEVWFSTMSHTITNYGTVVYNLNGRTEHITQELTYPDDTDPFDGNTCYYTFENGTLEFYGTDYLTRRANTNVWISAGCTRHIMADAGRAVQSAQSYSPLGYEKGGRLLVDAPYVSRRGSVLRSQARFDFDDTLNWIPGASFTVAEHQTETLNDGTVVDWSGPIVIGSPNGQGSLNFMDNYQDGDTLRTFENEPFHFNIAAGETNRVEVPLTGHANIIIQGGGTMELADCPSTVSGTLTIKAPSVVVVEGPESLGYLDVIVEPGAYLNFKETGRPQKYCRSITMQDGSYLGLGPDSSTIEPENPIRLLELGHLTMPKVGVDAITRYNEENSLTDPVLLTDYGVSNVLDRTTGQVNVRHYGYARAFQNQYVELFGLLGELIWDMDTPEGEWFSRKLGVLDIERSKWHEAETSDPLEGYAAGAEFVNFKNERRNSVTFLSPALVTVNNRRFAEIDYPATGSDPSGTGDEGGAETGTGAPERPENRLLPSGIIFATPPGTEVDPDSAPGTTLRGGTGAEIKIIGSADDAVIGSADDAVIGSATNRTAVLATRGTDAVVNVPIWLRNLTVEKNSYLRLRDLVSPPELTVVEKGSHLAFGAKFSDFVWDISKFRGEGRVDKIGDKNVVFDVSADDVFPNPLGVREGELKLESSTETPTLFTGGLFLTRYEESMSTAPLTIFNTAGKFGWVFDGTAAPYNVEIDDHAVLCGRTFGLSGINNVTIAPGKIFHIEAPITEYGRVENGGVHSHVTINGGTIRFSESLGASDQYLEKTLVDITSESDNRLELNGKSLYIRNALFNGTLAALYNGSATDISNDALGGLDKIFRIDFPGATNETPLVNFPLPVKISVSRLPVEPQGVIAFDEDGREIPCEVDSYIPDGVSNDAGLLVWVLVPQLSKSSHIFIGVKNECDGPLGTIDPGMVWKDYIAVWHMNVDRDGTLKESTTNHWKTTYHASGNKLALTDENYAKWQDPDGPLGKSFYLNDRTGVSGDVYNGFAITNAMIKFMAELPEEERTGLTTEGFFKHIGTASGEFQKVLSYRIPGANYYNFSWLSMKAGALWGSYIAYVTNRTDTGIAIIHDAEKMPIQAPTDQWFFSGATLTTSGKEAGQILALGDQQKYLTSYDKASGGAKATSITLGDGIYDADSAANPKAQVGLGCRMDAVASTAKTQAWTGRMSEIRVRKGTVSPLWMDTVRRTALLNKLFTSVYDVSPNLYNAIKATESIRFAKGSVIEIQPGCIQEKALLLDLTTTDADGNQAQLITTSSDAGVTIDISQLGKLTDDMDETTLINVRGSTPVNIFAFKLRLSDENENPQEWALRALKYTNRAEYENGYDGPGTYIQLVKAQGAVMVISPVASKDELDAWPETPPAETFYFAPSGHDFAVIPGNYNADRDLRKGAVIRDRFEGKTDGITTEQLTEHLTNHTANVDYWFGFKGDNGSWSLSTNYTLNLRDDPSIEEQEICHVQFAVTNQIFYGQSTDTLNAGELGFYVTWDPEEGTNLVARVLNSTAMVSFPMNDVVDPWLIVSVTVNPYKGYDVIFNNTTNTIVTMFAEHPKQLRVTGVAAVDNIFVSTGDPLRDTLVYIHDMTRIGVDGDGNPNAWVDQPIEVSEKYYNRITSKAKAKGFEYHPPTKFNPTVQPLPVAFRCRIRRGGKVYDSDAQGSGMVAETGTEHLDRIDLLQLSTTVAANTLKANSEVLGGVVDVYKYEYEYALSIKSAKRHDNNAVTIYSVLSDSAESYDESHLQGTAAEPHVLNGYLYIESTDSALPYNDTNTTWKPVSISALPQFGENHLNETFVAAPVIKSNMTYRVRIQREYPLLHNSGNTK